MAAGTDYMGRESDFDGYRYPETKAPGTPAPDGGSGIGSRIAKARKYIFSKIMEKWMTIKNK